MAEPILEVRDVRKSFGERKAVDGISLAVEAGQILGLLGPNGAGKTTTVSLITGLLSPDAGEIRIAGRALAGDTDPAKASLGLAPQDLALFDELSAGDNLRFFGALYDMGGASLEGAVAEALRFVGLQDRARDRVKTFSGGMKRRLNLAAALLHDPRILLLDEPTVGVDPQSRSAIFDSLEELRRRGKAIVYTTHYMEEAARLADRIVIVDHGRVIADDTLRGLLGLLPAASRLRVDLAEPGDAAWVPGLRAVPGVVDASLDGHGLSVGLGDLAADAPRVLGWLAAEGHPFTHVASERGDLETVFLSLTGRTLRDQ
jgi:ABC-2 type transport system ATP-binding protein